MGKAAREKRQRNLAGIVQAAERVTRGHQDLQKDHAAINEQVTDLRQRFTQEQERFTREIVAALEALRRLAAECKAGNVPSTEELDIVIKHCDRELSARRAGTE